MDRTDVLVIGGGQAGLAMSRCLRDRAVDHVVVERGRVGERWRSERWESLRMLTPRWMSRLPGFGPGVTDPDGYMTMPEVVQHLESFARSFEAPVQEHTRVISVKAVPGGYRVVTDRATWNAAAVVIATGSCDLPYIPEASRGITPEVHQLVPALYRRPRDLPDGGVLVVGASSTGVQLAAELRRAGRKVVLAVGRHTRLPRTWRGRDIFWWLERLGVLDERADQAFDLEASREQPSLQLVGTPDRATLDLGVLQDLGVRLAGRLVSAADHRVRFAPDLAASVAAADAKLARLIARIEAHAAGEGPAPVIPRIQLREPPPELDLRAEGIGTVLWATGYRRSYPWLEVPVLDETGELRHVGGITPSPGLYVLGLPFLRRRRSSYLDGVGADASELADVIVKSLERPAA